MPEPVIHLDDEDLERYSMGEAREDEAVQWEQHLLICEGCRSRLAAADAYVAAMRGAASRLRQPHGGRAYVFPISIWLPVAACLTLATLAALLLVGRHRVPEAPAAVAVRLTATRGPGIEARAPSKAPLRLQPDLTGLPALPSYSLEVVDSVGKPVWRGAATPSGPGASAPPLAPGTYFVRVSSPQGELFREYGLEIVK